MCSESGLREHRRVDGAGQSGGVAVAGAAVRAGCLRSEAAGAGELAA